jgi:diadenosine tetraphosphate (Ap4A) HIT family hydrolase
MANQLPGSCRLPTRRRHVLTEIESPSVTWPQSFYELRRGDGCPMCEEGRPDDNGFGIRVLEGHFADAYLQRASIQRGYIVVIWRGRHVVELTELRDDEATSFWNDVLMTGRAVQAVYEPLKMNYLLAGNTLPHLHAHVLPRYETSDPNPGAPFPFPKEPPPPFPEAKLQGEAQTLRAFIGGG